MQIREAARICLQQNEMIISSIISKPDTRSVWINCCKLRLVMVSAGSMLELNKAIGLLSDLNWRNSLRMRSIKFLKPASQLWSARPNGVSEITRSNSGFCKTASTLFVMTPLKRVVTVAAEIRFDAKLVVHAEFAESSVAIFSTR